MMNIDPVCGMKVSTDNLKYSLKHGEKQYYFCSEHCLNKFKTKPEQYDQTEKPEQGCCGGASDQASLASLTVNNNHGYTCPDAPRNLSR